MFRGLVVGRIWVRPVITHQTKNVVARFEVVHPSGPYYAWPDQHSYVTQRGFLRLVDNESDPRLITQGTEAQ